MRSVPLPLISPEDYHGFWRLLHPALPGPYEEWLIRQQTQTEMFRARHGGTKNVAVNLNEFVRFCQLRDTSYSIDALMEFTAEKERGKKF